MFHTFLTCSKSFLSLHMIHVFFAFYMLLKFDFQHVILYRCSISASFSHVFFFSPVISFPYPIHLFTSFTMTCVILYVIFTRSNSEKITFQLILSSWLFSQENHTLSCQFYDEEGMQTFVKCCKVLNENKTNKDHLQQIT